MRRSSLMLLLLPAALTVQVARAQSAAAPDQATVSQQNRAFSTHEVQIARGGIVHVTNNDDFTHEIYVQSPSFSYESDEQEPGRTVDVTFPKAGSFDMQCHIHPKMHLRVDVR